MLKKFSVFVILAASCVIFMPAQSAALAASEKAPAAIEYSANAAATPQRNRRWQRTNNRRWNNRRWNNRRVRVIRQVFYRNGRRYVRYIRVYR